MIVIYAEKSDVGKKIAAAIDKITLSTGVAVSFDELDKYKSQVEAQQRKDGFLKVSYFTGEDCFVTWGWGHMFELKNAYDYNSSYRYWKNIPSPFIPEKFEFLPKLDKLGRNEKQLKVVKQLFDKADLVISATDNDREGECIFKYVYDNLGCKKPYKRAIINEQTEKPLREAFLMKNLVNSADRKNIEDAGSARGIADWVVGVNLSTQFTLKNRSKDVLSVGRVQTAALAMLAEREKQITGFTKTYYYTIDGSFTTKSGEKYSGTHVTKRFENKSEAESVYNSIKSIKNGVVTDVKVTNTKVNIPKLYNQSALQMECNSKFGLKLADTLSIAQFLYDNGYTTYPRTSSQYLTDDMEGKVNAIFDSLQTTSEYENFIKGKPRTFYSKEFFDSTKAPSHFAIIPTGVIPKGLTPIQQKVYDLIAKSLIRILYEKAEVTNKTITTEVDREKFTSSEKRVTKMGWYDVTPDYEEKILPKLSVGDIVTPEIKMNEKETKPPKSYTDKTFLGAMISAGKNLSDEELKKIMANPDNPGIGTEATRAAIVETLINRGYAERDKKNIRATSKGIALIDDLCVEDVKSPEITARWEQRLAKIEKGEDTYKNFTDDIFKATKEWCDQINKKAASATLSTTGITSLVCPVCGKNLNKYKWGWGCSGYSTGCKFSISETIAKKKISETQVKKLLQNGTTDKISGFTSAKGKKFDAKLKLDSGKIVFTFS